MNQIRRCTPHEAHMMRWLQQAEREERHMRIGFRIVAVSVAVLVVATVAGLVWRFT